MFLDEISAMPYDLQKQAVEGLQEEYIRRVGGNREIPVDVRIIAAVNEPVERLIRAKPQKGSLFQTQYNQFNPSGIEREKRRHSDSGEHLS